MPSDCFQCDTNRSDYGRLAGCLGGRLDELAQVIGPLPGWLLVVSLSGVVGFGVGRLRVG